MAVYFFLRYGLIVFFLVGWIFYQKTIKKKNWAELEVDATAVLFFVIVWLAIVYFFTH